MIKRTICALVLASCFSSGAWGAAILIDDFESGQTNLEVAVFDNIDSMWQDSLGGVIGGRRDVSLELLDGNADGATARINYRNYTGTFTLASDPDMQAKAIIGYGIGGDLNADLFTGNSRLEFQFFAADLAGTVSVLLTTTGQGSSVAVFATPGNLNELEMLVYLPYLNFSIESGIGANFADIDRVQITLTGAPNGDYKLQRIRAVPEPSIFAMLSLMALAIRRKQSLKR